MNSVDPPSKRTICCKSHVQIPVCARACESGCERGRYARGFRTHSGPGQPHHHSWRSVLVHSIHCENRFTHVVLQVVGGNGHGGLFTAHDTERHLTENLEEKERRESYACPSFPRAREEASGAGPVISGLHQNGTTFQWCTFSTCFCRFRTPDSRQYCLMRRPRASDEIVAFCSVRPHEVRS